MTLVVDRIRQLIPPGSRQTPSGWTTMNAPCCHHRGHRADTKHRGGIRFDTGVVYHCFNCGFTTGWQPGSPIGEKLKHLVSWLGGSDDDIKHLVFEALKTERQDYDPEQDNYLPSFETKTLPQDTITLIEALEQEPEQAAAVADYLIGRGFDITEFDFLWSPELPDRAIVPFHHQGQLVGYTARRITDRKPKYLSSQNPHTVFNLDQQPQDQQHVLVCEGPFDALAVGGVAVLSNEISEPQARLIERYGYQPILIPDQDQAGLKTIDQAVKYGWQVAFPSWESDVKDCAQAVQRYGRLFVIVDAVKTAQQGEIRITMAKKKMINKLENEKSGS